MSWADSKVYLSTPEEVVALDTTKPRNGAPGLPGEFRWCYAELESGEVVLQKRRLCLNTSGGSTLTSGLLAELTTTSQENVLSLANVTCTRDALAGFVPEKVNESALGGVAQGVVPDDYWFWAIVEGKCDMISAAAIAAGAALEAAAAGQVDDTGVAAGTDIGRCIEAGVAAGSQKFEGMARIA